MTELEIIGAPQPPFVRSARMACAEKGVAYRLKPARPHSPEVDCIHPFGKIPVMWYGDFELCESKAIATFVDRAFPGPKLFPEDAKLGAKVEQWVSITNTAIVPALIPYFGAYFFPNTPDGQPDRAAIESVLPSVRAHRCPRQGRGEFSVHCRRRIYLCRHKSPAAACLSSRFAGKRRDADGHKRSRALLRAAQPA
jgi:hypothetical protein